MSTIEQRVQNGVELLDRVQPGWDDKIDLSKLRMQQGCNCILGQVYGNYADGIFRLQVQAQQYLNLQDSSLPEYGLCTRSDEEIYYWTSHEAYRLLTAEWTRVILERRVERQAIRDLWQSVEENELCAGR